MKRREAAMPLEDPDMSVEIRRTSGTSLLKLTRSSRMINQLTSAAMQRYDKQGRARPENYYCDLRHISIISRRDPLGRHAVAAVERIRF